MLNLTLLSLFLFQSGTQSPVKPTDVHVVPEDYEIINIVATDLLKNKEYVSHFGAATPRTKRTSPKIWIETETLEMFPGMPEAINADIAYDPEAPPNKFSVSKEISLSFARKNSVPISLADFKPQHKSVTLWPSHQWMTNEEFFARYPDIGWLRPWLPGYSQDGKRALCRFVAGPSAHGIRGAYMLKKTGTKWKIEWRFLRFGA